MAYAKDAQPKAHLQDLWIIDVSLLSNKAYEAKASSHSKSTENTVPYLFRKY